MLVTGAAGFIGFHVAKLLLEKGFEVVALDNLSRGSASRVKALEEMGASFVEGDVRDLDLLLDVTKGVNAVAHLAALISVEESFEKPLEYVSVNVEGTVAVLEAGVRRGVKKFVLASSAAVYGDPQYLPIDEAHPLRPKSPYGASKVAAEAFAEAYSRSYGIEAIALRIFNVYGPGQNPEYAGVISRFVERAVKGLPPVIFGDGGQTRDFVHVEDVAEVFYRALTTSAPSKFLAVNVASGSPTSINELARLVVEEAGLELKPVHAPSRPGDIYHSYADVSRVKELFGWSPRRGLREGLKELLNRQRALSE